LQLLAACFRRLPGMFHVEQFAGFGAKTLLRNAPSGVFFGVMERAAERLRFRSDIPVRRVGRG